MDMPAFGASQTLTATQTFANAPQFDALLVPGGMGCFDPNDKGRPNPKNLNPVVDFVKAQYPGLKYLITVCTGSAVTSLTGLLDGKRATTFKGALPVLAKWRPQVQWVPRARWVVDGNIWTSSGVSSGMDVAFAFVKEVYGEETAAAIATWMEYVRHEDGDVDPFGIDV
ncbi:class I glutamine amidotransferase-like protein [Polyplosphaeria fusca]|uniref:Class I glutamine amidotransferase-like protein n=1 Tax=Polyplosphaeria fusca TaxID=682080 RepID=A0A9P4UW07_9PLEO|nr:class I glutamine amidotransferase-like protein [Polyplosphaeria fusca]